MLVHRWKSLSLVLFGAMTLAGCAEQGARDEASDAARDALNLQKEGTERTTEVRRDLLVRDTEEVIDRKTGEVITTKQTETPVTITKEKEVETDINVRTGDPKSTVK